MACFRVGIQYAAGGNWSFCGGRGKCVGNSRGIKHIRAELVFRGTYQECSHNSNEISAFPPELVFRQIPGKSVQRGGQSQWLRRLFLRVTLLDPIGYGVVGIRGAPPGLGLFPPRRLALWLAAGMLARSDSRVGAEPMAAKRTRSFPGRGHRDSSSQRASLSCCESVQAAWVILGKQRWESSRERRSITRSRLLDRTLIYTALTRGIEQVVFIGDRNAFDRAIIATPQSQERQIGFSL